MKINELIIKVWRKCKGQPFDHRCNRVLAAIENSKWYDKG
jgi:hypothetical protein